MAVAPPRPRRLGPRSRRRETNNYHGRGRTPSAPAASTPVDQRRRRTAWTVAAAAAAVNGGHEPRAGWASGLVVGGGRLAAKRRKELLLPVSNYFGDLNLLVSNRWRDHREAGLSDRLVLDG